MKRYSQSLLLLLGVAGCTQDPTTGTTTVSGQVVENQSRKPVANATVQVYQTAKGGGYTKWHATISLLLFSSCFGRLL
ncbi:MAG: hypothetical protein ACRYFX_22475 [Janthinobacterium lividum]